MTTGVVARFEGLRKDLEDRSVESYRPAFDVIVELAHEVPLIGAMAMRNLTDILAAQEGQADERHRRGADPRGESSAAESAPLST
jgi:hypothetical protein